jgi:carbonic anhydrase/acetyltransferase-like protein (isoleucine patch superfamily)
MALILSVMGHVLKYGDDCYFAENPAIIAYVIMGNICNVWFNAVKCRNVNTFRTGNRKILKNQISRI